MAQVRYIFVTFVFFVGFIDFGLGVWPGLNILIRARVVLVSGKTSRRQTPG